jgi:transposase-like protein
LWADDKVTIDESARRLDVHRETILYWRGRFLERRKAGIPECLQDLPRSGRPPAFSPSRGSGGQGGGL